MQAHGCDWKTIDISTLAPREGSDFNPHLCPVCDVYFNPRSPRGERRNLLPHTAQKPLFQPSLPARGATLCTLHNRCKFQNFNPRSPRGERPPLRVPCKYSPLFQPSLPARGATRKRSGLLLFPPISTLAPREGSDCQPDCRFRNRSISTLAPREGSDKTAAVMAVLQRDFNPRSPRGERQVRLVHLQNFFTFQPSLPARGATSISTLSAIVSSDFNPRSPRGERLQQRQQC